MRSQAMLLWLIRRELNALDVWVSTQRLRAHGDREAEALYFTAMRESSRAQAFHCAAAQEARLLSEDLAGFGGGAG